MRKKIGIAGLFSGILVSFALVQAAETYTVVKVSNFDGSIAIDALDSATLANLRKDVALENRLIKDAYQSVAQEWKKSHKGKTVKQTIRTKDYIREVDIPAPVPPFPLKSPKPRVISPAGTFPTAEAAAERKKALEAAVKPAVAEKDEKAGEEEDPKDEKDKGKSKGRVKGAMTREKVSDAEVEQLYNDMMSELTSLKEAATSKGGKTAR